MIRRFLPDPAEREEVLGGGRITQGVVRVGDTVRRPPGGNFSFVRTLLLHLEEVGFSGAPRFLGKDERGREVFSHITGTVPPKWRLHPDEVVSYAGRLLADFHRATATGGLCGTGQVVCHHDPGPHNAVFVDGLPVAFIDFDGAAPGPAIEDVAYACWAWCISSRVEARPLETQCRQVWLLATAYGLPVEQHRGLVEAIIARQSVNRGFWLERQENAAGQEESRICGEMVAWTGREQHFLRLHQERFHKSLMDGR